MTQTVIAFCDYACDKAPQCLYVCSIRDLLNYVSPTIVTNSGGISEHVSRGFAKGN